MSKIPTIKPFANESEAVTIGEMNIENHADRVSVFGELDLTRDKAGLRNARALRSILDSVVRELEADKDLPDQVPPVEPEGSDTVDNPFA